MDRGRGRRDSPRESRDAGRGDKMDAGQVEMSGVRQTLEEDGLLEPGCVDQIRVPQLGWRNWSEGKGISGRGTAGAKAQRHETTCLGNLRELP